MDDISEYERRITAALDRAAQALDKLSTGEAGDAAALKDELEAERVANQQLEERVRAIKDTQEQTVARLEASVADLQRALATRDGEMQRLKAVNEDLRTSNGALREANAQGVGDADAVNAAMVTEIESLRAARAAERADPVLKEA